MKLRTITVLVLSTTVSVACDNAANTESVSADSAAAPVVAAATETKAKAQELVKTMPKAEMKEAKMQAEAGASFPTAALVDPNAATPEELAAIPGMTAVLAQAVISARPFASPTELNAALLDSAEEKVLHSIYRHLFIKVGLNNGAEDDYKLIPTSLSPRKLAHEFEEYRPYDSLAQFNKEMSKYVSAEEVAFLERYVFID